MSLERAWIARDFDGQVAQDLASALHLNPLIAGLLVSRGISGAAEAETFLKASLADMPDPGQMADIRKAAERLIDAVEQGEKIVVYGDYDVDGVTSSAVLWLFFRDVFGVEIETYIPHRLNEGYGLNIQAIDKLSKAGAQVLVTVDNGSSAVEEVQHAKGLGLDVIIIDHHQISDPEPSAFAHLNPHRETCRFGYSGLAAVGVAFILLVEIRRVLRENESFTGPVPRPDHYLDLVALGTVADVAPLTGLNRAIVRYGVERMRKNCRPGVGVLLDVAGGDSATVTERDFGFRLGPRINAAGRLDDASRGLRLLIGEDYGTIRSLAAVVEQQNTERKQLQATMAEEARHLAAAEANEGSAVLVLAGPDWHPGVVGIVASKIVEEFHRPAILLAEDGGVLKGSARSTADVNIKAALDRCSGLLMRYGGHVAAAGMTLRPADLDAFRKELNQAVEAVREGPAGAPPRFYDAEVNIDDCRRSLFREIQKVGPFGQGNPAPVFVSRGVVAKARPLRGGHLKMILDGPDGTIEGLAWNMLDRQDLLLAPIDILYTPDLEVWRGRERMVFRIHDFRAAGGHP